MVGQIGLRFWLWQRLSAVFIASYVVSLLVWYAMQPTFNYAVWSDLFASEFVRLASFFIVLNIALHAWIGTWGVLTDYVKPLVVRFTLSLLLGSMLLLSILWSTVILWR